MKQQVIASIRRWDLWNAGDRVAVAVSGGPDSVAMLHVLHANRALHGAELSVVHIDHGWHEDSGGWARRVDALAVQLGLPCTIESVRCAHDEAAAREARYRVLDALPVDRVALGHHADDQAETVLINLLRGGRGLRGMAPRRGRYVRPLLDATRDELRAWCSRHDLGFVEDPSNQDPRHLRTRVRELVPVLEGIRPGSSGALARLARNAALEDALLEELAAELPLETGPLAVAPRPLVRRRLRQAFEPITDGPLEALVDAVRARRGVVELPGGRRVRVTADRIVVGG